MLRRQKRTFRLESLERRELKTANVALASNGDLYLWGTQGTEVAFVSEQNGNLIANMSDAVETGSGQSSEIKTFPVNEVKEIIFDGCVHNPLADHSFFNISAVPGVFLFGGGNNFAESAAGHDTYFTEGGTNTMVDLSGNNDVLLRGGNNVFLGLKGNDTIWDVYGNDYVLESGGTNEIHGPGADFAVGEWQGNVGAACALIQEEANPAAQTSSSSDEALASQSVLNTLISGPTNAYSTALGTSMGLSFSSSPTTDGEV